MKRTLLVTCFVLVVGAALVCAILSLIGDTLYIEDLEDLSEEERVEAIRFATTPGDVVGWSEARVRALMSDFEGVQNSETILPSKKVEQARKTVNFARAYLEYAPTEQWVSELELFIADLYAFLDEFKEAVDYGARLTSESMAFFEHQAIATYNLWLTDPERVASAFRIRRDLAKVLKLIGPDRSKYESEIARINEWLNKIVTDDEDWEWIQDKLDKHMDRLDEIERDFGTNRLDKWSVNSILEAWKEISATLTKPQFNTFIWQIDRILYRSRELLERFDAWIKKIDGVLPMVIAATLA